MPKVQTNQQKSPVILKANELLLDPQEQYLSLDGKSVPLVGRGFQLLLELMRWPQQLLSKQALIDAVWQGRPVSDAVLATSMKEVRRALNDPARKPVYIETVHGKGYRFLLPVDTIPTAVSEPVIDTAFQVSRNRWWGSQKFRLSGVAVMLLLILSLGYLIREQSRQSQPGNPGDNTSAIEDFSPDTNSIAVLPFLDLSPEGDQGYFSDGISEEVLNVLSSINALKVIARTSSFAFKSNDQAGIADIAQELNVQYVLEGSVRKSGDTIRITAQLIDSISGHHLWSGNYDRTLTAKNIFAIQDDISNAILVEILGRVGLQPPQVSVAHETGDINAYDLYLRANNMYIARGPDNVHQSVTLFEQATQLDDQFAQAWAGLAAAAAIAPAWGFTDRNYDQITIEAADKAIAINPELSLPYAAKGLMAGNRIIPDFEIALQMLDLAIEKDHKNTSALLWRGTLLRSLGYFDRALADMNECQRLDPALINCRAHASLVNFEKGDIEVGIELWKANAALGWGGSWDALLEHFVETGNETAFLSAMRTFTRGRTHAGEWMIEPIFQAWTNPDYDREAGYRELMARLSETGFKPTDDPVLMWRLWFAFGVYDQMKPLGLGLFRWAPTIGDYAESPDRVRLIKAFGMPEYWRKHGYPAHCQAIGETDFECR